MQTRLQSFIESVTNIGIGFAIAVITQIVVYPLFGLQVSITDNLLIASIFTVISIARSYCVRRIFNWRIVNRTRQ